MIKVLHILLFEIFVLIIVEPIKIFQIDYNGKWLGNFIKSKSSNATIQYGFSLL